MILCTFSAVEVSAATKMYAEDKLVSIQKTKGFVPGKDADVLYNCFGFISNVCEKLYGVTYDHEILHDNYLVTHTNNYYTVKTLVVKNATPTETDAKKIRDFFINNAQPGDVIHYGGYGGGSTHTFMVQHIDSKKMQIYHSNYGVGTYSSASCHIDDIIWSKFVKSPTKSEYDENNNPISLNSMFYNKMKSQGLGITINRYSKYTDKYKLVDISTTAPSTSTSTTTTTTTAVKPAKVLGLAVTSIEKESIGIKWNKATNASKYYIHITNNTKGTTFDKTVTTNSTSLNGLTEGNSYTIKVRAISSTGTNGDYSSTITVKTKAMINQVTGLERTARTTDSISIKWNKVPNATKYFVYIKNATKGSVFSKVVTTTSTTLNNFTPGNTYAIKVKAYVKDKGYGDYSFILKTATNPNKVTVSTISSPNKGDIKLTWKAVEDSASGYQMYLSTDSSFKDNIRKVSFSGATTTSKTVSSLTSGKTYYVKIRAYKKVDGLYVYGAFSTVKSIKCK